MEQNGQEVGKERRERERKSGREREINMVWEKGVPWKIDKERGFKEKEKDEENWVKCGTFWTEKWLEEKKEEGNKEEEKKEEGVN